MRGLYLEKFVILVRELLNLAREFFVAAPEICNGTMVHQVNITRSSQGPNLACRRLRSCFRDQLVQFARLGVFLNLLIPHVGLVFVQPIGQLLEVSLAERSDFQFNLFKFGHGSKLPHYLRVFYSPPLWASLPSVIPAKAGTQLCLTPVNTGGSINPVGRMTCSANTPPVWFISHLPGVAET